MDIHERLKAIYDNCLAHMTDTPGDWERAFNALNAAVKNAGNKPEDVHEALRYYDLLEKQVGEKDMSDELKEMEYYDEATYTEMKSFIHARQMTMVRSYIAIGFYLRRIRDEELYREDGYADIHAFALDEYGMHKSTVNHCMRINEHFSKNGRSPVIDERYKDYSKAKLQEILYLPEDKREDVTPDMTIKQIRGMKDNRLDVEPENEQIPGQMNVYDFPEIIPEEPISVLGYPSGCGEQSCFSCHRDGCNIRQEYCYCVEAPMGNPFPCTTLNVVGSLVMDIGNSCQFVNEDLAYHSAGDGQPVPCCKKCVNPCGYECSRSVHSRQVVLDKAMESNDVLSDQTVDTSDWPEVEEEPVEIEAECMDDMDALPESQRNEQECCPKAADGMVEWNPLFIRDCLETEERNLKDYHAVEGLPFVALIRQEALVVGLRKILSDAESVTSETDDDEAEEDVYIQPELPMLKNNDQRKEWLRNYKDWGLWYEDEHIGCKYYKYEFENGATLIAETYVTEKTGYYPSHESCYLHLFGGQPCKYGKYGQIKYQMHEKYDRFPNSETELVEFFEGDTEKMKQHEKQPSEAIEEFLNYVDQCRTDYQMAHEAVGKEDKRLQDLIHEMEFADGKNEKGRAATKLQQSRKYRRKQKDEVLRLKELVEFFDQQNHKNTLNKMRQLLGKQRKTEEYLDGQRKYKPRVKEE